MAVIGVYSAKGGVGKTTIAVDLAWRSSVHGNRRTLLWDLDSQGGSAYLLGSQRREIPKAASVFQRDGRPGALIEPTAFDKLSLLQADDSLRHLGVALARLGNRRRLAQMTAQLRGNFERIVLDCPPAINEVSDQILNAVDLLVVPLPASPLAQRTFDMVLKELRAHQVRVPVLPVLSMYNQSRLLHREVRADIAADWPLVPLAPQLEEAAVRRAPLGSFCAGGKADKALHKLWQGIEAKLGSDEIAVLPQQQLVSA